MTHGCNLRACSAGEGELSIAHTSGPCMVAGSRGLIGTFPVLPPPTLILWHKMIERTEEKKKAKDWCSFVHPSEPVPDPLVGRLCCTRSVLKLRPHWLPFSHVYFPRTQLLLCTPSVCILAWLILPSWFTPPPPPL